jgi:heavy metal sensor kinase
LRSLRFRLSLWAGALSGLAVAVFCVAVVLELRYVLRHTLDQEMADLASDIFAQLVAAEHATGSEVLPEVLALFDENNIIRVAEIRNRDGSRLYSSPNDAPLLERWEKNGPAVQSSWIDGRSWRVGRYSDSHYELDLVADLGRIDSSLLKILVAYAIALPFTILAVVIGGAWISRRALAPLRRVTEVAKQVSARELDRRIDDSDAPLEVQELIQVLNGMMDRLEQSFSHADRFSSDASHEMRTPLTVMQGLLEQALARDNGNGVSAKDAAILLDETQRLIAVLESLMLLSRAQAGNLEVRIRRIDFSEIVEDLEEDLRALASGPGITVQSNVATGVEYEGDEGLLRQAVFNLFTNAVRHNREGGEVRLSVENTPRAVILVVFNTGEPIPEADRDHVFDRFFRGDASRSRASGGTGLGLNLAREIARAHGGELTLVSSTDSGTTFSLRLPHGGTTSITGLSS